MCRPTSRFGNDEPVNFKDLIKNYTYNPAECGRKWDVGGGRLVPINGEISLINKWEVRLVGGCMWTLKMMEDAPKRDRRWELETPATYIRPEFLCLVMCIYYWM